MLNLIIGVSLVQLFSLDIETIFFNFFFMSLFLRLFLLFFYFVLIPPNSRQILTIASTDNVTQIIEIVSEYHCSPVQSMELKLTQSLPDYGREIFRSCMK